MTSQESNKPVNYYKCLFWEVKLISNYLTVMLHLEKPLIGSRCKHVLLDKFSAKIFLAPKQLCGINEKSFGCVVGK